MGGQFKLFGACSSWWRRLGLALLVSMLTIPWVGSAAVQAQQLGNDEQRRDLLVLRDGGLQQGALAGCDHARCTFDGAAIPRARIEWIGLAPGHPTPPGARDATQDELHLRNGAVEVGRLLRIAAYDVAIASGSHPRDEVAWVHLAGEEQAAARPQDASPGQDEPPPAPQPGGPNGGSAGGNGEESGPEPPRRPEPPDRTGFAPDVIDRPGAPERGMRKKPGWAGLWLGRGSTFEKVLDDMRKLTRSSECNFWFVILPDGTVHGEGTIAYQASLQPLKFKVPTPHGAIEAEVGGDAPKRYFRFGVTGRVTDTEEGVALALLATGTNEEGDSEVEQDALIPGISYVFTLNASVVIPGLGGAGGLGHDVADQYAGEAAQKAVEMLPGASAGLGGISIVGKGWSPLQPRNTRRASPTAWSSGWSSRTEASCSGTRSNRAVRTRPTR
jgi:hypothetical protein